MLYLLTQKDNAVNKAHWSSVITPNQQSNSGSFYNKPQQQLGT